MDPQKNNGLGLSLGSVEPFMILLLVGGLNPSEKYESIGMIIPNIWEIKNVPNHQPGIVSSVLRPLRPLPSDQISLVVV